MPDLQSSLLKHDLGHLQIIAGLWGLELDSAETDSARKELSASLLDLELVREILETLSPNVRAALDALIANDGRMAWAEFTRQFGGIREMGAGKRDRERPHLKPASTSEALFYRGFLARAFFDSEKGAQEFAYIPDDLLALIQFEEHGKAVALTEPLGRPASPAERGREVPANDSILDEATTALAALRMGKSGLKPDLQSLLAAAKLIQKNGIKADAVKTFLEAPRNEALTFLFNAWKESDSFNELRLVPELICEGEWTNQPQVTREFLLNLLEAIPDGKWWSLNAFVRAVKETYPDFQRPAGDYDSWFIKRAADGQYLRGFAYWDHVDGALIRFFIANVLHWLGRVDLSFAEGSNAPTAFRLAKPIERKEERGKISVSSNGKIACPRNVPRVVRYQLARFCEWLESKNDESIYRLTPRSLNKAKEQGLEAGRLLPLLAKHSAGIPPSLIKALKNWEVNGTEARVETQVILRVSRPEVMEEIRKSKAAKYLGELISPTTAIVKSGAIQKIEEALTELGFLTDVTM